VSRLARHTAGCLDPSTAEVLGELLADEHAAVYAYGLVGAHLPTAERRLARAAFDAHRAARDVLRGRLVALGETPPAPHPAYDVRVADRAQALALAVRLEEGLAVRWRDLVAVSDARPDRRLGVQQLQDCAVRAARWRRVAGLTPTVALPGAP
jgi:hypothetical protein